MDRDRNNSIKRQLRVCDILSASLASESMGNSPGSLPRPSNQSLETSSAAHEGPCQSKSIASNFTASFRHLLSPHHFLFVFLLLFFSLFFFLFFFFVSYFPDYLPPNPRHIHLKPSQTHCKVWLPPSEVFRACYRKATSRMVTNSVKLRDALVVSAVVLPDNGVTPLAIRTILNLPSLV